MSDEYAIETIDTGLHLPILFNSLASILNLIVSIAYVIILSRVLNPSEFLIYTSIFTFYSFITPLINRLAQWSARDYVRWGDKVIYKYSGLYSFAGLFLSMVLPIISYFTVYSLPFTHNLILVFYGLSIITFNYMLLLVGLVAPRFFNMSSLISVFIRLITIFVFIQLYGRIEYIIPILAETIGYSTSFFIALIILRNRISYRLFIPSRPDIKYISRTVKLSITNYLNMVRSNIGAIHYFILFYLRLSEILINSFWLIFRILRWGRSFFRGFFVVAYSRQFYKRMNRDYFLDYFNLILYLTIPFLMFSLVIHQTLTSIFNPKYIVYSLLVPISILLIIVETFRTTLIRTVFGSEDIDISLENISIKMVFDTRFFKLSFMQFKIMVIFFLILAVSVVVSTYIGLIDGLPYIFASILVFESTIETIFMYRSSKDTLNIDVDLFNPFLLVLASIPGTLYLYFFNIGGIIVRDIFIDVIPVLIHLSVAFITYFIFSMISPWVRIEIKRFASLLGRIGK